MKKFLIFLLVLMVLSALPASSLRSILPSVDDDTYSRILSGEIVRQNTSDGDLSVIAPSSELVKEKIDYILSLKKGFGVCVGSLVPYPEEWSDMTGEERELALYNSLLKVSTQKGLTYISHRAGDKEKTLFEDSYMLSSPDKKDRIDDPVVTSVPAYAEYYAYQDDTSFGGNVYSVTYTASGDEIFMDIRNNNDLHLMGINIVKTGKVNMSLDIVETDEGIYVYALASVKDKNPKMTIVFYTVDLELSFYNRIVALSRWFRNTIGSQDI